MRKTAGTFGLLTAAIILFQAENSRASACVPGHQVACACPGGSSGVQACSSDRARFEACACSAPTQSSAPQGGGYLPQQQQPQPYAQQQQGGYAPAYGGAPNGQYQYGYPPPHRRPKSGKGMFVGGLIMTILGAATIPLGIGLAAAGGNHDCQDSGSYYNGNGYSYSSSEHSGSLALCIAGTFTLIVDAALIGIGIPMMIIGKNRSANAPPEEEQGRWWVPKVGFHSPFDLYGLEILNVRENE